MKKSLRSKILLCVLAGGVLAANTALAAEYKETQTSDLTLTTGDTITVNDIGVESETGKLTLTVNGRPEIIASNENGDVIGINIDSAGSMLIDKGGEDYVLKITATGNDAVGIRIMDKARNGLTVNSDLDITAISNKIYGKAYGINALSDSVFNGDIVFNIQTDYDSEVSAIRNAGEKLEFNGKVTSTIDANSNITSTENGVVAGVHATYGSETVFNDVFDLTFNANSSVAPIIGVFSFYSNPTDGYNSVTFNDVAKIVVNNEVGMAVGVMVAGDVSLTENEAAVYFKDDVDIITNGYDIYSIAILTQANGIVDISKNEMSTSLNDAVHGTIIGAIQAGGGEESDESVVNINLTGADSLIEGDVNVANEGAVASLGLHDSAVWRPVGFTGGSLITNLEMNDGIIEQTTSDTIDIQNYYGSGTIKFLAEDTADDGIITFNNIGNVIIEKAAAGSVANLSVTNDTINTLDIAKTEENLNAIANKLFYTANDGNLSGTVTLAEGLITPAASGVVLFDANNQGYVINVTGGNRVTETMDAMKNISATNIIAWRQEDSTLSQRLGELRHSDGGQGVWVRMTRGEFEYGGEYKNQYNYFQMGYDWAAKDWHYGAAVSYNDGQTTYTHGKGENSSTSLSLYGTWLGSKGHYADIVLKQGRLSNDFDIYTSAGHTSGDYNAWGTSLSGEYGRKVDLNDGWFITPQAQLTLMRIGGEDYTTNNGIKVHQDTLTSAVGRVGFEVGKQIDGRGSVYAKASLLHDFAGSADTYLSLNGLSNSYRQDISDTWCEAGLGFNYKTSANSYIYADVVKTFGGDVETPWQWNAGMRWMF